MSRTSLNAAIDTIAYAGFVFLRTTGLMLRYQLPPGSGRLHGMGSGAGAAVRDITTVWGLGGLSIRCHFSFTRSAVGREYPHCTT
jgi:hypothetical protein